MQVVQWVLADAAAEWARPDWQQHLSGCAAFLSRFMPLQPLPQGGAEARPALSLCNAGSACGAADAR
jgi:hypothetical protein